MAAEWSQTAGVKEGFVFAVQEAVTGGANAEGAGDLGFVVDGHCQAGDLRGVVEDSGMIGCGSLIMCMIFWDGENEDRVKLSGNGIDEQAFEFCQGRQRTRALRVSKEEECLAILGWGDGRDRRPGFEIQDGVCAGLGHVVEQ